MNGIECKVNRGRYCIKALLSATYLCAVAVNWLVVIKGGFGVAERMAYFFSPAYNVDIRVRMHSILTQGISTLI